MAVTKFREAHVNKRAEYYRDGMLDELLVELERMDLVVFYWLKGHSGAVVHSTSASVDISTFKASSGFLITPGYHPCSALGSKAEPRTGDKQGRIF
jgi:hypothetical protein